MITYGSKISFIALNIKELFGSSVYLKMVKIDEAIMKFLFFEERTLKQIDKRLLRACEDYFEKFKECISHKA